MTRMWPRAGMIVTRMTNLAVAISTVTLNCSIILAIVAFIKSAIISMFGISAKYNNIIRESSALHII